MLYKAKQDSCMNDLKYIQSYSGPFWRRSALGLLWREWCWSWNSSTLATSCEELTHWKRLWCWEGLGAGGEGGDRGWDGWMASLTQWTWVWVNSRSWCWTGRPGVLQFMGSKRVGHDWVTELNWMLYPWNLCYKPTLPQSKQQQKRRAQKNYCEVIQTVRNWEFFLFIINKYIYL